MSRHEQELITPRGFTEYWEREYAGCPPIGYLLRQTFPDRWFRIHTLPASKRYAEFPADDTEILRRHNSVLSSILSEGGDYVLITTGYSDNPKPVRTYPQLDSIIGSTEHWLTTSLREGDETEELNYWHFFFIEKKWKMHSLDELLKLVAEDVVANVLLVSFSPKAVYHPYDGGADVIIESAKTRASIKQRFESW